MTRLRSRLCHGTAIAAALAAAPANGATIALPNTGVVASGTVTATIPATNTSTIITDGTDPTHTIALAGPIGAADRLNLGVGISGGGANQSAVVNWASFDIGTANAVTFTHPDNERFAVLNRVTGGLSTTIAGILQGNAAALAGNRGTIFVVNEAGLAFANTAQVVNLTGLVASSLGVTDLEFANYGSAGMRFTGVGIAAVTVDADAGVQKASLAPDSVLLLVAPKFAVNGGALTATDPLAGPPTFGDVGFVLASDATVNLNATSIISIKIDAGTAITTSAMAGTISGNRVLVAAASTADLVGSLLGVTADLTATTATATDRGIVIAIGRDAPIDATHAITFTPADPLALPPVPGAQLIAGVDLGGTLTSGGRIDVVAGGPVSLAGAASAGGTITASGSTLRLGVDGAARSFVAGGTGAVGLTTTAGGAGGITTLGDVTVTGGGAVTLEVSPGVGAAVGQDGTLTLTGASLLVGAIASNPAGALAGSGDVTLAALGGAATDGVVAGTVAAQGAVVASSANGSVTLGGATSGSVSAVGHDVHVRALLGNATISGPVTATKNLAVLGGDVVLGGAQAAVGDVLIKAATGAITVTGSLTADSAGAGGHVLVLDAFGSISGGAVLVSGSARESDVLLATGGDVTLGNVDARELARAATVASPVAATDYSAVTAKTLVTGGAIGLGIVTTTADNTIGSTGATLGHRDVVLGGDTSTAGSIDLGAAGGALTIGGLVSAATSATVHADFAVAGDADPTRGVLTVDSVKAFAGDALLTGGLGVAQFTPGLASVIAASGNVGIVSTGPVAISDVRAGGAVAIGGIVAGSDAGSLQARSVRGGGAVTVDTSGALTLTGANIVSDPIGAAAIGAALDPTLTTFTGAAVAAADVTLASSAGVVTVLDMAATGSIIGSGSKLILGADGASHAVTAGSLGGAVTLTASDTGAAAITTRGDFAVSGGGAIVLQRSALVGTDVTQNDSLRLSGTSVLVGNIALAATLPTLFGSGDVTLAALGLAATDATTAGTIAGRNAIGVSSAHGRTVVGGAVSGTAGAAPHDITVSGGVSASVDGIVTSAGNYTVTGGGVTVATAGAIQTAVGDIYIRSASNIYASGTLVADGAGAGNRRLVLDAAAGIYNSAAGPVSLRAGAGAVPTATNRSDILLSFAPGQNLALGTVDADVFSAATPSATPLSVADYTPTLVGGIPALVTGGAIAVGAFKSVQAIVIGSTGTVAGTRDVTLGGVTSAIGSVEAFATTGNVKLTAAAIGATSVSLHADAGTLTEAGVKAFDGNASLIGGTTITKGPSAAVIAASGNVSLASPGAIAVDAVRAGGTITVAGLAAGSSATSLGAVSLVANGGISIATAADIVLTGGGIALTTPREGIDPDLGGFSTGTVASNADIRLTSTAGAVTLGAIAATGGIFVSAATTATVAGNVDAGTAGGAGDYVVAGTTVTLGDIGTTQKATGNVWLRAAGGLAAAGTIVADDGGLAGIGVGASRLVLDAGSMIGGGASLRAGAGTPPTGANRSDILVRLGVAAAPVTLGDIDARQFVLATAAAPLSVADYAPVLASNFETAGKVSLGNIAIVNATLIGSTGTALGARDVSVGAVASRIASVEVRSASGAVTVGGPVSGPTGVSLHAGFTTAGDPDPTRGVLTLGDVASAAGDVSLVGGRAIATMGTHSIAALGMVSLRSDGGVSVDAVRAGGAVTVAGASSANGAALTADSLEANGAVTVTTTGAITLAGLHATSVATRRKLIDTNLGGFNGAPTAPDAAISLTATGSLAPPVAGTITINGGVATGDLRLTAGAVGAGGITASGSVIAGDAATVPPAGDIVLSARDLASLAAGTARRDVSVTSTAGNATIGTANAGRSVLATANGLATITSGTAVADVIAQGASARITFASAGGNVRALGSAGSALVTAATAATGNVDALATTTATIGSGTATLGNVRATSTGGGLATITTSIAGQSIIASGGSAAVTTATAGDDIILAAASGPASATTLTVTGVAIGESAATDASGGALLVDGLPLTGLGGSNVIIRASGPASVAGSVTISQAVATKAANYDIAAGSISLGTSGTPLAQAVAGRVDLVATTGGVTFLGTGGALQSNRGGNRIRVADGSAAGGGLAITSATAITGTGIGVVANAKTLGGGFDLQSRQPGVTLAASAGGGGGVTLASVTGGGIAISVPATIAVPTITASGDVSLLGVTLAGNDTATIAPTTITIDGLGLAGSVGFTPAAVTLAGGAGAQLNALSVVNGGRVSTLAILSDTGAATLLAAPALPLVADPNYPTAVDAIVVESQTSAASILNASVVAARTITIRGRQAGATVSATGPLLARGSAISPDSFVLATGPTVTLGTVTADGVVAGVSDIGVAATGAASLAAKPGEAATAGRSITVTAGTTATLGDGTATAGALAVRGATVTVVRRALAGDDVLLTSSGAVNAPGALIMTSGSADLQIGDDSATISLLAPDTAAGTGYGLGHGVIADVLTPALDTTTGGMLTRLGGANIVITAAAGIDLSGATLSALVPLPALTLDRDIRIEAVGDIALGSAAAERSLIVASGGSITPVGTLTAGDDLVLVASGTIDATAATLRTVGATAPDVTSARRGDGSIVSSVAGGGTLTGLAGSNIALTAGGTITLGAVTTAGVTPASLRAFGGGSVTTTQVITTSGAIALVGNTISAPFALTAGDDIVAVAAAGPATLGGVLTTTGAAASATPLFNLAGGTVALPGEAPLGRVEGASIVIATTGVATVRGTVASAGRYSVYGRSGIALGTSGGGTAQGAAGDVLLEASIGAVPSSASVVLAPGMTLTANSDGIEAASGGGFVPDSLVVRLGNGSLVATAGAALRVGRTAAAALADQGVVTVAPVITDGVKAIAITTLDSARADLRALGAVTVGSATVDGSLTLVSKAGVVTLGTLSVADAVPAMTAAERGAVDLALFGATGASLGTTAAAPGKDLRDITVATTTGPATISGAARARDDIVVTSTLGVASAGALTFVGAPSDSELGSAAVPAVDANGVALTDLYVLSGATIAGLGGRNIVVAGGTGASLTTASSVGAASLGDVRVLAATGSARLTTVDAAGSSLPGRVIVATRNGSATGTTLSATGDIIVDATLGSATLTTGTAGRDAIVVAPTVSIGTVTAGDDIAAVATTGDLTATSLMVTGLNAGDAVAASFRPDGSAIVDPVAGGTVTGLLGGNIVALARGGAAVGSATAAAGGTLGVIRIGSGTGATVVTTLTSAGDIDLSGTSIAATTVSAGLDARVTAVGAATIARLTAGRDATLSVGTGSLGLGGGLVAAQRNLSITASGALAIGTARAGGDLAVSAASVIADLLGAGNLLTVTATDGDALIVQADSTARPLLADFGGFATTGSAPGVTRDLVVTASGTATLTTASAVHGIAVTGQRAVVATAITNTGATDGDLIVTAGVDGAQINTGSGRDVSVATTGGGDIAVSNAVATRDIVLAALGAVATLETGSAGHSISINAGRAVVTTATANTGATDGDVVIIAGVGGAQLDSGSGRDVNVTTAGGGDIAVTKAVATRDIVLAAPTAVATLRTGSAGHSIAVTGRRVAAISATANTGATDGDLVVTAGVDGAQLDSASARDISVATTGGGDVLVGSAFATRDLTLLAPAAVVTLGTGSAGHSIGVSGNRTTVAAATASTGASDGDLVVLAGVGGAQVDAGSGRDVNVGSVGGGDVSVTNAVATRDIIVAAPGAVAMLGTGRAVHAITVSGRSVILTSATANTGGVDGNLIVAAGAGGAKLAAGRAQDITVTTADGGDVLVTNAVATRDLVLAAPAAIATLGTGSAGHSIAVSAARAVINTATANIGATDGDLIVAAGIGGVRIDSGSARDVIVTTTGGGDVLLNRAVASRDLMLAAPMATAVLKAGSAGHSITLSGRSVTATSATANTAATNGDVSLTGDTDATLGTGVARDIQVTAASGTATASTATATRDILIDATTAGLASLGTGTAGHTITVRGQTAFVAKAAAGITATDGDLTVSGVGGDATLTVGSGRDVRVTAALGGAATATTLTATRDLFVDGDGAATLARGTAGRDGVVVGRSATVGTLTAGDDAVVVAVNGALTTDSLISTGANSGDGVGTIARANGSPLTDPTTAAPLTGLVGGTVVALSGGPAAGDVTVTTATAPTLVRLATTNGTIRTTTATATSGDLALTGTAIAGGALTAGRDIAATAADLVLGTVAAGRALAFAAANDITVGGATSAGTSATLTATRDITLGAVASGDALDAGADATLAAGRAITVARAVDAGGALAATAGASTTLAGTASGGATTLISGGDLLLTAPATAVGTLVAASSAGGITATTLSGSRISLTAAKAINVAGAATSTSTFDATAATLTLGSVTAAADTSLHATGPLTVTGSLEGGTLRLVSDSDAITTGAVTSGPATIRAGDAVRGSIALVSLTSTGSATLVAGQSAAVTGKLYAAGALSATATNGGLTIGAIAAGGPTTLRARTALTVNGVTTTTGALDALASNGAITLGSVGGATTVTLRGAAGVTTGGVVDSGLTTILADAGPVSTGDINSGGDVGVTASAGSATLASVSRAARLTVTAASDATVAGAVNTTGDTAITATSGGAALGGAVQTANYTISAASGTIALGTGVIQRSAGVATLTSQRLTIGAGSALVATSRVELDVVGNPTGVSLGDGAGAASAATRYSLSKADLRKVQTPWLQINAGALPVAIGEVDLDKVAAVASGMAGVTQAFGVRTTSDIVLADTLSFTSDTSGATPTIRKLTLGGVAARLPGEAAPIADDGDKTTPSANAIKVVARSALDNAAVGTGGQINAAGSLVQLRATYIALGEAPAPIVGRPFIDSLLPAATPALTTAEARTLFVDNAASALYVAVPPYANQSPGPQALVRAGTLVLAPGKWALIQNTGPSTTPGGGIDVGVLKFTKIAGAAAADPAIAVFGGIAGKTGLASAISVAATNLDGISPNSIRINGCVALSTAGCIQSAVSVPLIYLADPARSLLISTAPDLALSIELITGATNEALWREDDDDTPGENRPQRDSRP